MAHLRTRQKIANKAEEPFKHATRPLKKAALAPLIPPQQGVEMIQLASRLNRKAGNAGKVASGKENVVEVLGKQKERSGPNGNFFPIGINIELSDLKLNYLNLIVHCANRNILSALALWAIVSFSKHPQNQHIPSISIK